MFKCSLCLTCDAYMCVHTYRDEIRINKLIIKIINIFISKAIAHPSCSRTTIIVLELALISITKGLCGLIIASIGVLAIATLSLSKLCCCLSPQNKIYPFSFNWLIMGATTK